MIGRLLLHYNVGVWCKLYIPALFKLFVLNLDQNRLRCIFGNESYGMWSERNQHLCSSCVRGIIDKETRNFYRF